MLVQKNGSDHLDTRTVYYAGTDKLKNGYNVCYDVSATKNASDQKSALGTQVVKPATANLMAYAGVVAPQSDGKTGPCFIDILLPAKNRFVEAYCKINATAFTTLLGPVNDSYSLGAHSDSGVNLNFVGVAAETADTSSADAVKLVLLK